MVDSRIVEYRFIVDPNLDQEKDSLDSSGFEPVVLKVSLHNSSVFFIG